MTTGIVVAGGASRRFGPGEKALATVAGSSMLHRVVDRLEPIVDGVVVNCREEQRSAFEAALSDAGQVRFAIDSVPDGGPVVGLATAIEAVDDRSALVVGCDFPLVTTAALSTIHSRLERHDADVVVPRVDGRRQPLCGAYRLDALAAELATPSEVRGRRLGAVLDRLDGDVLSASRLPGGNRTFWNVNTRTDLEFARRFAALESLDGAW